MKGCLEFGLARPEEASSILGLFEDLFPTDRQGWVPLGCPGALAYVRDTIARQEQGGENVWVVARDEALVGCAEIRRMRNGLFLNHLLVSQGCQGQGVGRRLLADGFHRLSRSTDDQAMLDVFQDNERARTWYERLGFQATSVTLWESSGLTEASIGDASWFVAGLAQADCVHARYGFSMFELVTVDGRYQIGRLGSEWFRVAAEKVCTDPTVVSALRRLGPDRRLLLLRSAPAGSAQARPEIRACGLRMATSMREMLSRLSQPGGSPV